MIDKKFLNKVKEIKRKFSEKAGAIGIYRFILENPDGSKLIKYYHNVLTIDFFQMIMNNMTDPTPDNDMLVSHCVLGDDDTLVDQNDHTLGNETYRNVVASMTCVNNVGYFTAFFDQAEVSGTFKEAGFVSDGTGTVDTGILVSHVNIDVAKTLIQKLTIDWTITLTNKV